MYKYGTAHKRGCYRHDIYIKPKLYKFKLLGELSCLIGGKDGVGQQGERIYT